MDTPEFAQLRAVTAAVTARLRKLYVRLFGSTKNKPTVVQTTQSTVESRRSKAPDNRLKIKPSQNVRVEDLFPQVWTDTVDEGLDEIIDAMDKAANSVTERVPQAEVAHIPARRAQRARAALEPAAVARRGFISVQAAMQQPAALETEVRGRVSGILVMSHTEMQRAEARRLGGDWQVIWIAERDACVRCLAYAGMHVGPDALFPGGKTFGPAWASITGQEDFNGPGLGMHPHCRCELRVIHKTAAPAAAEALEREARRSVAKGWSLPSESPGVRVDAAKRLVGQGARLPKSVVDETRRRLKKPAKDFVRTVPSVTQ